MKRIGLTGNIGSGKSTIASCFKILGISVFNSDDKAKFIMNNNSALKQKMINHFGENVFNDKSKVNLITYCNYIFLLLFF